MIGEPPLSGASHVTFTAPVIASTFAASSFGLPGAATAGGSKAANIRMPPDCRAIAAFEAADSGYGAPCWDAVASVQFAEARQPLANATSIRPWLSRCMSLKSRRFRQGLLPPPVQMQPSCTGSWGVTFTVVQLLPPS